MANTKTTSKKPAPSKETVKKDLAALNKRLAELDRGLAQLPKAKSTNLPAIATERPAADPKMALDVEAEDTETDDQAIARKRVHPVVGASLVMRNFDKSLQEIGINAIVGEVGKQVNAVVNENAMNRPEAILVCQAQALDMMFGELASYAAANIGKNIQAAEAYLRMALKAQAQSRATIETLNELKNPRQANFIRQQNVAHQQQVNNGVPMPGAPSHAHGSQEGFQSNELLEAQNGERLDTGATCKAGGADKDLEAVEVVDRAENGGGKSGKQPKRAAARPKIRGVS